MNLFYQTLEAAVLVCALTLDGFVASFAYGADRIRIPLRSALVIDFVCTLTMTLSLFLGETVRAYIPAPALKMLCFSILFALGLFKCFDRFAKSLIRRGKAPFFLTVYAAPQTADADRSKVLSAREALALALALSLDGLAAGFGAALGNANLLVVLLLSLWANLASITFGEALGKRVSKKCSADLSWLSGAALILLALAKL